MATFLFSDIIFGPVFSRRLGVSLGINLLPANQKICNFNCIYCECGKTYRPGITKDRMPDRALVKQALTDKLEKMSKYKQVPDVITFAGNGEPTLHPDVPEIIKDTIEVRNRYFPQTEIAVLSNSTNIHHIHTREALLMVDKNILKLDSAINKTLSLINRPNRTFLVSELIEKLMLFKGNLVIQTMFITGSNEGINIDNTSDEEITAWLAALSKIRPSEVQIYTVSRDVPDGHDVKAVPLEKLEEIAEKVKSLGIPTQVSG